LYQIAKFSALSKPIFTGVHPPKKGDGRKCIQAGELVFTFDWLKTY